jgi:hypothetical protein
MATQMIATHSFRGDLSPGLRAGGWVSFLFRDITMNHATYKKESVGMTMLSLIDRAAAWCERGSLLAAYSIRFRNKNCILIPWGIASDT